MTTYTFKNGTWYDKKTGEEKEPESKPFIPGKIHLTKDIEGYSCPVTGKWIDGRKAHRDNLARHGCRIMEKGEKEDFNKRRADADKQMERDVTQILRENQHNF